MKVGTLAFPTLFRAFGIYVTVPEECYLSYRNLDERKKDMTVFHPSLELGQHGAKSLAECLRFAYKAGCLGVQPSNYHFELGDGFITPAEVRHLFATAPREKDQKELKLDSISAHCVFWVHGAAWTRTPTIRPFIPERLHEQSPEAIERWAEDYIFRYLDLAAALGRKVCPMFWGPYHGWEVATGYPWGFFSGPGYDLIKEGNERFVEKTKRIRDHARANGQVLAHEIHPNSGAQCADDFLQLVEICDGDTALGVFADPSHCWDGEDMETRFSKVAARIVGAHVKDHRRIPGRSLRSMQSDWKKRGMHFELLGKGQIDLTRYVQMLVDAGLPERWNELHGTAGETVPLCAEAESAYFALDAASKDGVRYVASHLCHDVAQGSFEDEMGA